MRRTDTLEAFFKNKQKLEKKHKTGITKISSQDEKKEFLIKHEEYKASQNLSDDDYNRLRTRMMRDIDYIAEINKSIKTIYSEFTQYKLDVLYNLYEFKTTDEAQIEVLYKEQYDDYANKIISLKKKRDAFILKQKAKIKSREAAIIVIQKQIQERLVELEQSSKEERQQLYIQITNLKKNIFDILEPSLSMLEITPNKELFSDMGAITYATLNTDYMPIYDNEKPVAEMNISPENVALQVEEIE
jgi:hypothetical protein